MGGSTTQTTNNKPYEAAEPAIQQGLTDLTALYNSGGMQVDPYQGQMVAPFTEGQKRAFGQTRDAARAGLNNATAAGDFYRNMMDPEVTKRAMNNLRNDVRESVMPGINSTFAGSGMTGSSLHQRALSQGLSRGMATGLEDLYQNGQNRAMQAAGMLPLASQAGYDAAGVLQGVADRRGDRNQAVINADIIRDQQGQQAPIDALQNYLALSTGAGSMFGVQSSTQRRNPGLMDYLSLGTQALPFF